jgi:Zn-dependent metalloprotease
MYRIEPGSQSLQGATAEERALEVLSNRNKALPELSIQVRDLALLDIAEDQYGATHVSFGQHFRDVPVFGAIVKVHFDSSLDPTTINGTYLEHIALSSTTPIVGPERARQAALAVVAKDRAPDDLAATEPRLWVYRQGLARGSCGADHLAWEIEVGDSSAVRELLYIDARDGRLLDRIDAVDSLNREVHRSNLGNVVWREGDPLPYSGSGAEADREINLLIDTVGQVYALFANLSAGIHLSWNGEDSVMRSVQNFVYNECPNAFWNGVSTNFCLGMVSDDVAAHEWGHAYTDGTHHLVYQWQPGALNEAYSDIVGELVDQLNDPSTEPPRSSGGCSVFAGNLPPELVVHAPASVAGSYPAGGASFNPLPPWSVRADVEIASSIKGCVPLTGFTPGNIALVDRGECLFKDKVTNAINAGATGVIVVNINGESVFQMGGGAPILSIPALIVGYSTGEVFKAAVGSGLEVTLALEASTDPSYRWLIGEDTVVGGMRDMWHPICMGDPGKVSDPTYACNDDDNGGVHTNNGIANHAFALLVDGGTYNGIVVGPIGELKSAHLYWRAMSVYQTPVTDFAGHADALEQSCQDLIGVPLLDLAAGVPSSEAITADDCAQVAAAIAAVELRVPPLQCSFTPLLDPTVPPTPGNALLFEERFDADPSAEWILTNEGVYAEYQPRDWTWTESTPAGGDGGAFFAIDSVLIGDCQPGHDDQSGVMSLASPAVVIPLGSSGPAVRFDHWVATERDYDGGNVKLSVNGGDYQLIPGWAFTHNRYNANLYTSTHGNTNPMAGEAAFTGTDGGSFGGSWGQSVIDLTNLVAPGDTIRLRFDFGVDGCNGAVGWYVDNLQVWATRQAPRSGSGRVGPG